MRIPVGKISIALLSSAACLLAQNLAPTTDKSAPAQTEASPSLKAPGSPTPPSGDSAAALEYLYNRKPQEGSAGKQALEAGKRSETRAIAQDAIGANRQEDPEVRARFDRYLGMAEVPQETLDTYFVKLKDVEQLLRTQKVVEAWKALQDLADYTVIDAGVSKELANHVEAIWNTGRANSNLAKKNDQLRKDVKAANSNADMMSDSIMDKEVEMQRRLRNANKTQQAQGQTLPNGGVPQMPTGGEAPQGSISGLEGKLQLTEEYLRSLELKAKIKMNELKQEKLLDQAKKDFAEYISTLFNSGRFNHVVLAADFYRKIFEEGDYPSDMAKQVNASLEINRDVQSAVEVFRYKVGRKELLGASDSLQLAFVTSELNPSVLGLERPLKEQVADFNRKLLQMRNLIEARDFGTLENVLSEIKITAVDFDTTKPLAIVNAVKLESKMHLGKAKLAAQSGDNKVAMEEFQAAAESWPGNPDLESKAGTFFDTQDVKNQSLTEFDRLMEDQNYRAIFDKQLAFAPAIKGDSKREEQIKTALESVKNAEVASEKANLLVMNGDTFGAWEAIELASANLPDDRKLNKLRADLAGRSAEFVASVNKARDAEGRNELGYSLTWYVNAQRQYPASQIANQGIDRLSKKLLGGSM